MFPSHLFTSTHIFVLSSIVGPIVGGVTGGVVVIGALIVALIFYLRKKCSSANSVAPYNQEPKQPQQAFDSNPNGTMQNLLQQGAPGAPYGYAPTSYAPTTRTNTPATTTGEPMQPATGSGPRDVAKQLKDQMVSFTPPFLFGMSYLVDDPST
jgi:hypothetical protein